MAQKRSFGHADDTGKSKQAKLENIVKPTLFTDEIKEEISKAIREQREYVSNCGLKLYTEPFPCFVIKDFFSDTTYVDKLKNELQELTFTEKSNDLFKFYQSNDLREVTSKNISILRNLLFGTFRNWLKKVMNISLDTKVDMSCAKYEYTDMLLCHDDELEGRRIAFIYYLVPEDWNEEDGGSLDMFSVDENGHPEAVVQSIVPSYNSFVFFEVSEKSFHQVSEVLSQSKSRLSISGWFHGEILPRKRPNMLEEVSPQPALSREDDVLLSWINPTYLNAEIVVDIAEQFEENSEIQLKDFLLESKYDAMVSELNSPNVIWNRKGPSNQRLFWSPDTQESWKTVHQFLELIKSEPFFKLLKMLTGLDLAILEEEDDDGEGEIFSVPPTCVTQVRRWEHGCYTLLHDQDPSGKEFVLDMLLHFCCDDWDESLDSGNISYIAKDGGAELITVQPTSNCLSLVYRDEETTRFVKYINHRRLESCKQYYDISSVYFEGEKE